MIYSVDSGSLFDVGTGQNVSIHVDSGDDIHAVYADRDRISVVVERNGDKMVDIYQKGSRKLSWPRIYMEVLLRKDKGKLSRNPRGLHVESPLNIFIRKV
jgi:hypothetical protein